MMNRYLHIILLAMTLLLGAACTDEKVVDNSSVSDEEVWVTIPFGHHDFERTTITTRSTLSEVAESRVNDLYLFIFVGGKSVYNNYFGSDSKKSTKNEVENAGYEQCWYVSNRTSESNDTVTYPGGDNDDTHGAIHIRSPKVTEGTLYLVANTNAYTVNISPDKLSTVRTEEDLKKLTANLSDDVVTRYGYFPMVGKVDTVTVDGTTVTANGNNIRIPLKRLDAKIEVKIKAAAGHSYEYEYYDDATKQTIKTTQTVKGFVPESWQVVNVPKGAFLLEDATVYDGVSGYFSTEELGFETTSTDSYENDNGTTTETMLHGFSFYMLENRYEATGDSAITGTTPDLRLRELRNKNADGTNATTGNVWVYAPDESTYLIIKGYLTMEVGEEDDNITKELGANVTYYVHLGDFSTEKPNDYAIHRNKHYTYSILVKGVKNIQVEVEDGITEGQPGAEGDVFVSQQEIHLFDAHYSQYTTSVEAGNLDINTMSWYVQTPFGESGSPKLSENIDPDKSPTEYANALKKYDYKWIWFMINPLTADGTDYNKNNQWYPGEKYRTAKNNGTMNVEPGDANCLMDVEEFVTYMKEQKTKHYNGEENIFRDNKVYFTIFIDEFYYEQHPIEGEASPVDLWKQFVNKSNRYMHILCGSNISKDTESSATNSVITIRQRSIQTPYNITKDALETAWGCETEDETLDEQLYLYDEDNSIPTNGSLAGNHTLTTENDSENNGLYNTALMLGLIKSGIYDNTVSWNTFLNYDNNADMRKGMEPFLNTNYKGMLYSILARNRDNDGDGYIDANELHWYVASLGQLYGIYIGELGFTSPDARLYDRSLASVATTETIGGSGNYSTCLKWRNHVVSSSLFSVASGRTSIVWAEEGISTSYYYQDVDEWKDDVRGDWGRLSIRCVRNLGLSHNETTIVDESQQPTGLVTYEFDGTDYTFDLTNVNTNSVRTVPLQGDMEMEATNENDDMARPAIKFKTGARIETGMTYTALKTDYLDKGLSPCPEGYHVPNVRETALIYLYCNDTGWWDSKKIISATWFSRGLYGSNDLGYEDSPETWYFNKGGSYTGLNFQGSKTAYIRPIMDITVP